MDNIKLSGPISSESYIIESKVIEIDKIIKCEENMELPPIFEKFEKFDLIYDEFFKELIEISENSLSPINLLVIFPSYTQYHRQNDRQYDNKLICRTFNPAPREDDYTRVYEHYFEEPVLKFLPGDNISTKLEKFKKAKTGFFSHNCYPEIKLNNLNLFEINKLLQQKMKELQLLLVGKFFCNKQSQFQSLSQLSNLCNDLEHLKKIEKDKSFTASITFIPIEFDKWHISLAFHNRSHYPNFIINIPTELEIISSTLKVITKNFTHILSYSPKVLESYKNTMEKFYIQKNQHIFEILSLLINEDLTLIDGLKDSLRYKFNELYINKEFNFKANYQYSIMFAVQDKFNELHRNIKINPKNNSENNIILIKQRDVDAFFLMKKNGENIYSLFNIKLNLCFKDPPVEPSQNTLQIEEMTNITMYAGKQDFKELFTYLIESKYVDEEEIQKYLVNPDLGGVDLMLHCTPKESVINLDLDFYSIILVNIKSTGKLEKRKRREKILIKIKYDNQNEMHTILEFFLKREYIKLDFDYS